MMLTAEGETVFCPGCPNRGNCLSPISIENAHIEVEQFEPSTYALIGEMTEGEVPDRFKASVCFKDEDGAESKTLEFKSPHEITREAVDEYVGKLLVRVGRCAAEGYEVKFHRSGGGQGDYVLGNYCPASAGTRLELNQDG